MVDEYLERLYSYLNLESTKTNKDEAINRVQLYSYLNLESTKTNRHWRQFCKSVVQLLKS